MQKLRNASENLLHLRLSTEDPFYLSLRADMPNPRSIGSFWAMQVRELEAPDHEPFQPEGFPPGYEANEILEKKTMSKVWASDISMPDVARTYIADTRSKVPLLEAA